MSNKKVYKINVNHPGYRLGLFRLLTARNTENYSPSIRKSVRFTALAPPPYTSLPCHDKKGICPEKIKQELQKADGVQVSMLSAYFFTELVYLPEKQYHLYNLYLDYIQKRIELDHRQKIGLNRILYNIRRCPVRALHRLKQYRLKLQ